MYDNRARRASRTIRWRQWHRRAVEQGYASAQKKSGGEHANGQGVRQNDKTAAQYRRAAEQGHAPCPGHNLGVSVCQRRAFCRMTRRRRSGIGGARPSRACCRSTNLGVMAAC
ncbi:MAG: hypothetical protein ACYYK0_01700 [Candidatus Eutrophobiaceae bacterium]